MTDIRIVNNPNEIQDLKEFIKKEGKNLTQTNLENYLVERMVANQAGTPEEKERYRKQIEYVIRGVKRTNATVESFKNEMNDAGKMLGLDLKKSMLDDVYDITATVAKLCRSGLDFKNSDPNHKDYNRNLEVLAINILGGIDTVINFVPFLGGIYGQLIDTAQSLLGDMFASINNRNSQLQSIFDSIGSDLQFTTWAGQIASLSKQMKNLKDDALKQRNAINSLSKYFDLSGTSYVSLLAQFDSFNTLEEAALRKMHEKMRDAGYDISYEDLKAMMAMNPEGIDALIREAEKKRVGMSPLVLDLGQAGIDLVSAQDGVYFDMDKTGLIEKTGWITPDDGFLAFDRNGDGVINNATELFSDGILLSNGKYSRNGFDVLSEFDSNKDGIVDANDTDFNKLLIWQDINSDGKSTADELKSLTDAGVASIKVGYTQVDQYDPTGAKLGELSSYQRTDGTTAAIGDYWFQTLQYDSIDDNVQVDIPEDIQALPNTNAMGNLLSLRKAMALDTTGTLVGIVNSFISETDPVAKMKLVQDILYFLADADSIVPGSRGDDFDAKKLHILEKSMNTHFNGVQGTNPNRLAAADLLNAYNVLLDTYYYQLIIQTSLQGVLPFIIKDPTTDTLDLSVLNAYLETQINSGSSNIDVLLFDVAKCIAQMKKAGFSGLDTFQSNFPEYSNVINMANSSMLLGHDGDDTLSAIINGTSYNYNLIYGGDGNDTISAGNASSIIMGGTGNDTIHGGYGNDTIYGGSGDDTINGRSGNDTYIFNLGDGVDTIMDTSGTDTLQFGKGINFEDVTITIDERDLIITINNTEDKVILKDYLYNYTSDIEKIKFTDGTVLDKSYIMANNPIVIIGTDGDDVINSYDSNDTISGGAGNDTISSGYGNDTIHGGAGDDTIHGGYGNDTYIFNLGDGVDTIYDIDGRDVLQFGEGINPSNLSLTGNERDLIFSINGTEDKVIIKDYFYGSIYNIEQVQFADGSAWDRAYILANSNSIVYGTEDNDVINGYDNNDTIYGDSGNDTINAGSGHDTIHGGAGHDIIYGGTGNDTLHGGAGDDIIRGDYGDDTYIFNLGDGVDTINDYGGSNVLRFGECINPSNITLASNERDLILNINDTEDKVIIKDYFCGNYYNIEQVQFADGSAWDRAYILANSSSIVYGTERDDIINGYDNNDTIYGGIGNDTIYGGYGNDTIYGGIGNDTITGGYGNDTIYGGAGDDIIRGDYGDDTYVFNLGDGVDAIYDTSGSNILQFGEGINPADITISGINNDLIISINGTGEQITIKDYYRYSNTIEEVQFADGSLWNKEYIRSNSTHVINGTDGNNYLYGYNNNDILHGGAGNDTIYGGAGDDRIYGEEDDDTIYGGYGDDIIYGEEDDDTIYGGYGDDIIYGGSGNDIIYGEDGNNTIYGGDGDDRIYGKDGNNTIYGGSGNDTIYGKDGNNTIYGGSGNDTIDGGYGDDTYIFNLGDGQDIISNSGYYSDKDVLQLGEGINPSNVNISGANNDLIISINGTEDQITIKNYYRYNNYIDEIKFADGNTWDRAYILSNSVNTIHGTDDKDSIYGCTGNDTIYGGIGNDTITGGYGNDTIYGGAGDDIIRGDYGDDTYVFNLGDGVDTINDYGGSNILQFGEGISSKDIIIGKDKTRLVILIGNADDQVIIENYFSSNDSSAKNDNANYSIHFADGTIWGSDELSNIYNIYKGTDGNDRISSGSGNDVIFAGAGDDYIHAGDGNNIIYGGAGDDTIYSQHGNNIIYGGDGNDEITIAPGYDTDPGRTGNNTIYGGAGDDIIRAGDGNDIIYGGIGNDTIYGNDGNDTYIFNLGDGVDTIYEGKGTDILKFGEGISADDINATRVGADLILSINNTEDKVILKNHYRTVYAYRSYGSGSKYTIQIEKIMFADGTLYDMNSINNLSLIYDGTEEADNITISSNNNIIYGGAGNDTIASTGNNNVIYGGSGNDYLTGSYGNDTYVFNLGDGVDTIYDNSNRWNDKDILRFGEGINPEDIIRTGSGSDLIFSIKGTEDKVIIKDYNSISNMGNKIEEVHFADGTIWGTKDLLQAMFDYVGTDGDDVIETGSSNASVYAGSGDDTINTSYGNDIVYGGEGNDTISTGSGEDTLVGGAGNDFLNGGSGNDTYIFNLGDGVDTIYDQESYRINTDVLKFGEGIRPEDIIISNSGLDLILSIDNTEDKVIIKNYNFLFHTYEPWIGNWELPSFQIEEIHFADGTVWDQSHFADYIFEMDLNVLDDISVIWTGNNKDIIHGSHGNDGFSSGGGDDILNGGAGDDSISGESGNDMLHGGVGNDYLFGGVGNDTYIFNLGDGVDRISENADVGSPNFDVLKFGEGINPEDIYCEKSGSNLVFAIRGTDDKVVLENAILYLSQYEYKVQIYLEEIQFADGTTWDINYLNNFIRATEGGDIISSNIDNDVISALGGDDIVSAYGNNVTINGGDGNDRINTNGSNNTIYGGNGNDTIYIDGSNNIIYGGSGDDYINCSVGNDTVYGGAGNDTIWAFYGDNLIAGGAGNDKLTGGLGYSTYIFNLGDGVDTISNCNPLFTKDTLIFGEGINPEDIIVTTLNDDLILSINGTDDQVIITKYNQFYPKDSTGLEGYIFRVSEIQFADGTIWGEEEITNPISRQNALSNSTASYMSNTTSEDNTYIFNLGDGVGTINDGSGNDTIEFGVNALDLIFNRSGNNLEIAVAGSDDKINVKDWYSSSNYQIEAIKTADGKVLQNTQVEQLIQAMASFGTTSGMSWNEAIQNNQSNTNDVISQFWVNQAAV